MRTILILGALACVALGAYWVLSRDGASIESAMPRPEPTPVESATAVVPEPARMSERSVAAGADPEPAAVAAQPASALPTELTGAEIKLLQTETPPGIIEGIVLRGREPLTTGGLVFHRRGYYARIPQRPRDAAPDESLGSTSIDARGTFRIVGLAPDNYTLALDLGHGAQNETLVQLSDEKPGKRVVIVLGGARVSGHVWNARGEPVSGARVCVSGAARTTRASSPDGSYEIADLPAGFYWFTVRLDGDWEVDDSDDQRKLILSAGEQRVIDFGSPEPARSWTGTVRTTAGAPVHGGGTLHMIHEQTGAYSTSPVDEHGVFRVPLVPGEYDVAVSLSVAPDHRVPAFALRMEAADVSRDITFPGTRVSGTVVDGATGLPWSGPGRLVIGLRPREGMIGGPNGPVDAKGWFALDGIQPGNWLLSAHPLKLVGGEREITVTERDVEIPLGLAVITK
jgi:hypothetical protein